MDESRTVINSYVEALISTVKSQGVNEDTLFSFLPVDKEHFTQAGARLDLKLMTLLWKRAVQLTGDELLGLHVGQEIQQGAMHILGGLLLNSENVKAAIGQMVRYQSLVSEGGVISLIEDNENSMLQYLPSLNKISMTHYQIEGVITSLVKFSRSILPSGLQPKSIEFTHSGPSDQSEYDAFFECPVKFNGNQNSVIFDAKLLTLSIPYSDPELFSHHRSLAEKKLKQMTAFVGLSAKVRQTIENESDWFELNPELIAKQLNYSLRQMQRKLNEEHSSYQKILDFARKEKAALLLERAHLGTPQIAEVLGYHNLSSFHRAFKRWYDCTPVDYRERSA